MRKKYIYFLILILFSTVGFAERNSNLDLTAIFKNYEQQQNDNLYLNHLWYSQFEFNGHLVLAPLMSFDNVNVQTDALIDIFFRIQSDTNQEIISIDFREVYIDLLFYNIISVKGGFIRYDYGALNSWYNPLNIVELLNLQDKYPLIFLGQDKQGNPGLPSFQCKISIPEFIDNLHFSLNQSLILSELTNMEENFLISKFDASYKNINLTLLMSYNFNSWTTNTNRYEPVLGGSLSFRLPLNIMFFGEFIYKTQSFRSIVSNSTYLSERHKDFYDYTVQLSYMFNLYKLKSNISTSLEFFHYGEGMTYSQYNDGYDFLINLGNYFLSPEYATYFSLERIYQNYLSFDFIYNFVGPRLQIEYRINAELDSGYIAHQCSLKKSYDNASIGIYTIYNQVSDDKYAVLFGNRNFMSYIQLTFSM